VSLKGRTTDPKKLNAIQEWPIPKNKHEIRRFLGLCTYYRQFVSGLRMKDLLKLNRDQLRWVVVLFTGNCHLKGHLFKLGLTDDPTCEQCLEKDESTTHILCDCEAIAYLRFVTWASVLWNQVTTMTPP
jgi:hypothetical protein